MKSFEDSQIFTNEDTSKPENRVNLALFSLMPQDWLREWFLEKLNLPPDSILYPPTNEQGARPDLKVETPDGSTTAWIEVELGTNVEQIEDYRSRYREPIKSVWGRRDHGGDLSLEEIRDFLSRRVGSLPRQTEVNVRHLRKLIKDGLDGHSVSQERTEVSEKVRCHPFVVGLEERLGDKLKFTRGRINPGELKADAIMEDGFSLRAFSPVSTTGSVFLLNIRGGSQQAKFPNKLWLEKYLPDDRSSAIEEYVALLNEIGLNIDTGKTNVYARGSLCVDDVLPYLDDLAKCVLTLVDSD
ncbi:MAG: hypothetical protein F4Y49_02875 [Dehalococcoidia bacterium]|nr:hypothetical protein [Dehalococcoidia bacterium]